MRIGIDIDGVLTNSEQFMFDYGSKYFYENYKKGITDVNSYDIKDIFNTTQKEDNEFWNTFFYNYIVNEPPRKFADEITKKLHEEGYEIFIITARFFDDIFKERYGKIENIVIKWLKKNNIYYDKLIFSPEDKLEICTKNNIEIMVEDSPHNITKLSKNIPVLCYNALYNQHCKGKNIIRCYSWYDIYDKINKMNKE